MNNRFVRNTLISSAVHLACVIALIVSSIMSCNSRRVPREMVTFFDIANSPPPLGEGDIQGGAPEEPAAQPEPQPEPEPAPEPKSEPKPALKLPPVPDAIPEPVKDKTKDKPKDKPREQPTPKPKIEISTNLVVRRATPSVPARPKMSKSDIEKMLGGALKPSPSVMGSGGGSGGGFRGGVLGGRGGGDSAYGWYYTLVREAMYDAWQQPGALAGKRGLMTQVQIRVKRDGTIMDRKMIKPAGNPLMDSSVMNAVETVKRIRELPDGLGGDYKDIIIDFELTDRD